MTEQVMTSEELAEAREFNRLVQLNPEGFPDGYSYANRTLVPRLLATVDALKIVIERDKSECEIVHRLADEQIAALSEGCTELRRERDEALATADAEREFSRSLAKKLEGARRRESEAEEERDKALALAAARGRALAELVSLKDLKDSAGKTPDYLDRQPRAWVEAREAIALPAPEALRQQQEREAEKDALIEALRDWLERFGEHSIRCDVLLLDDQGRHQACSCGFDAIAYSLTPPQALAEWRERAEALRERDEALAAKERAEADEKSAWKEVALRGEIMDRLAKELDETIALLEETRLAVEKHGTHRYNCPGEQIGMVCQCWIREVLSLTPPQALREREERETQATITRWAKDTFGEPVNLIQIWDRVMDEMMELRRAMVEGNPEKIAQECADTHIVLCQIPEHLGYNLQDAVNRKMKINRGRKWKTNGDGTGQHIE